MERSTPPREQPVWNHKGRASHPRSGFIIKVCGITNLEDALLSVQLGANALGFNFYGQSSRFVDPEKAREIVDQLPQDVLKVGIVVLGTGARNDLLPLLKRGINAIQIHGALSEADLPDWNGRVFIATSPEGAEDFPNHEIIIDTSWGSGTLADWEILRTFERPYILSGGLSPDNIGEALETLSPAGVDVCSGVELTPGKKDISKLRTFLSITRSFINDFRSHSRNEEN